MNSFLQIGIVLAVVWVAVLLISVLKKTFSLNRILLLLTLILLAGACFYKSTGTEEYQETVVTGNVDADRYFAAMYAKSGDYASAINLFSKSVGMNTDAKDLLALARLSALNNNYSKSKMFYNEYLKKNDDSQAKEELAYVEGFSGSYTSDTNGALRDYYEQNGITVKTAEDAGNDDANPAFSSGSRFAETVLERLIAAADAEISGLEAKKIKSCGEYIVYINQCMYENPYGMDMNDEKLIAAAKELNSILGTEGDLSRNSNVRNAALAANALLGDAGAVAKNICEYSTVYELSVATELYVNGYVDEMDFRAFPDAPDKYMVSDVTGRCKDIFREEKSKLSDDMKESVEHSIELIGASSSDYVLKKILILFTQKAEAESFGERSKFYMEAAKGFDYANMDLMVSQYIDSALENAAVSNDYTYAMAMTGIISIISNEGSEGVQKIPYYSKEALDRLMPVPMENFKKKALEKDNKEAFEQMAYLGPVVSYGEEGEEGDDDFDFTATLTEKLTQKKSTINIGEIDKNAFPTITTRFSFGSDSGINETNIKQKISVYDCGKLISDYEVKKIKNQTGKIILVCDMSGSMSGSDGQLREAVRNFADGKSDSEQVAVVGFTSRIEFQSEFMTDKDAIKAYADKIYASGGTSIYPTILDVANMFSDEVNDNNVIIVMTDGQDGSRPSDENLVEELNKLVAEHNCTIYTVGLGSGVDEGYLENIAAVGNGQYLYVDSADSLSSFYEFMHAQLTNSYVVTYTAKDTIKNDRTIEVEYRDSIGNAQKHYTLSEDGTNTQESYEEEKFDVKNPDSLQVYGFKTSYLYAGKKDVKMSLLGCNFKEDETYEIKLTGPVRGYTINYEYVSSNELTVTVPYTIAPGKYSVKITSSNESASAEDALTVVAPSDQKQFKFGSYIFTCDDAVTTNDSVKLSGNVIMNGWLHFKGDVYFSGDCNDEVSQWVTMTDNSGSFIKYSANGSAGIARWFAKKNIPVPVPKLGSITLYSEDYSPGSYKDFPVSKFIINAPIPVSGLANIGGSLALYPDMIYSEAFYTNLNFPYMYDILKNIDKKIYEDNVTGALAITNTDFLVNCSWEKSYNKDNDTEKKFTVGKMGFVIKKIGFSIDTIKQEYSIAGEVGFKEFNVGSVAKLEGFGLNLGWKEDKLDAFEISADASIDLCQTPVPLTLSSLSIGAENLASVKSAKDVLGVKLKGGFNLSAGDVINKVPKSVKEFFDLDSLAIAEFDEAKIEVTLSEFSIGFESNIKVLGIKVGKAGVALGKIDYDNTVLGIKDTEYGVDVKLQVGFKPSWKNLSADVAGEGRVTVGFPFSGLTTNGDLGYKITWWLFDFSKSLHGDFGIGVYYNSRNEIQFIVKAYGQTTKGKTKGFRIDISPSMGTQKNKY